MDGRPHIRPDWELALALLTYAAASAADYLLTLSGLLGNEVRELNPLLNVYIEQFGAAGGLGIAKVLLGVTAVLASSLYIHAMNRAHRTRVRAETILYGGALFTAATPAHWVFLKYWAGG